VVEIQVVAHLGVRLETLVGGSQEVHLWGLLGLGSQEVHQILLVEIRQSHLVPVLQRRLLALSVPLEAPFLLVD